MGDKIGWSDDELWGGNGEGRFKEGALTCESVLVSCKSSCGRRFFWRIGELVRV